ncbi:MAG TPA: response regulator [Polyangia bacterium]|nr:response regulator [Polyangia bacterium]
MNAEQADWLIVEDDPMLREELSASLVERGYGVAAVGDGREALELLASAPRPRCMLVDLWMPVMSGSDLVEHLAAHPELADVTVVVMTGTPDSVLASCLERAGLKLLSKPFTVDELIASAGM